MNIMIVANDAGGSEVIAAWVSVHSEHRYTFFLDGPAISIFQRRIKPDLQFHPHDQLQSFLRTCDRVITSSSWGSDIEKRAWQWCRELSIESVLYADGWADFRNGFRYDGKDIYPDQIWVTNEYALAHMVKIGAPSDRIQIVENLYLKQMKDRIHEFERRIIRKPNENRILYCSENISACEAAYEVKTKDIIRGYNEYEALAGFLELASSEKFGSNPQVRIRPHPSENSSKYMPTIEPFLKRILIEFSIPGISLEEDIAWAIQVVGCETTALALAVECQKKTTSCIPKKAQIQCRLPHKELIRIHS
jgi:hypothetical protein